MNFTPFDMIILEEIGNQSIGGASSRLSNFFSEGVVTISIPKTKKQLFSEIKKERAAEMLVVKIEFEQDMDGSKVLLLHREEALQFVRYAIKQKLQKEVDGWNEYTEGALTEMVNIIAGSIVSALSDIVEKNIKIKPPKMIGSMDKLSPSYQDDQLLLTTAYKLKINSSLQVTLMELMEETQAQKLLNLIKEKETNEN